MRFRSSSDKAASSGLRTGMTILASNPARSSARRQNGIRRHIRGSLSRISRSPPNSAARVSAACASSSAMTSGGMRRSSNGDQSRQWLPPACRMRSFKRMTARLSQLPLALNARGAISCLGAAAPSRRRTPATADVPVRCMPRTITATRRPSRPRGGHRRSDRSIVMVHGHFPPARTLPQRGAPANSATHRSRLRRTHPWYKRHGRSWPWGAR